MGNPTPSSDAVPVWADIDPPGLEEHLVAHHGYTADIVDGSDPDVLAGWHRSDHKFCWGIKHKDGVDQTFIHHTHPALQKRVKP